MILSLYAFHSAIVFLNLTRVKHFAIAKFLIHYFTKYISTVSETSFILIQLSATGCPLVIGFGSEETDEFQRQSRTFAEAWKKKGLKCGLVKVEGHHHFSINTEMCNANGALVSSFLKLIGKKFSIN